ncbi:MAG: hypothetical protein MI743_10425 [Sneathiellales bacterium]|nr:hypothetical protein [Sneathiellales bacterium]
MNKSILLGTVALSVFAAGFSNIASAASPAQKQQYKVMQHSISPKGPSNFAAPTGGYPGFSQASGKKAKILLSHKQIGATTGAYNLKGNPANKSIKIKIQANCPAGQSVMHLSYDLGTQMVPVYQAKGPVGPNIIKRTVNVTPWDNNAILAFASAQMGGNWQGDFPKDERVKTKNTSMVKNIKVISSCTAQGSTKVKSYKIRINQVKITDTDYD